MLECDLRQEGFDTCLPPCYDLFPRAGRRVTEYAMRRHLRDRLTLGLIVLIGTALRLCRLGGESLWYDETVSTALAGSPLPELIRHTAGDIHPPGYYLLLRGWLILSGYPTGHADPHGNGLEFAAGFFSLFFGILLIALVYVLARRMGGARVAVIAAALVAASPYNIWYSQEVRMYTLGAGLGVLVVYALLRAGPGSGVRSQESGVRGQGSGWWAAYAVAAAAGMYTLYYFVFLLIPLNFWALCRKSKIKNQKSKIRPWLLANLAAVLLYAPWIPVAWRQATNPPVPPWRTAPNVLSALQESWTALSLGQSAPGWLWPALLLTLALYALGVVALYRISKSANHESRIALIAILPLATFGSLALILLVSLVTPLYHVRYLFTYSPAFYVVLAAGADVAVAAVQVRRRGRRTGLAGCGRGDPERVLDRAGLPRRRSSGGRPAAAGAMATRRCRAGERGVGLHCADHLLGRTNCAGYGAHPAD